MGDRTPEEKKSVTEGVLGSLSSLVGLATQIGTAVPGLKKQPDINTQRGAAGDVAGGVARAAVGASQTGFGATRGLNLRTGLRQAGQVAKESGGAIAQAAGRDERQTQLFRNQRNQRLAEFGADAADFAANLGQGIVEARQAKSLEPEPTDFEQQYPGDLPGYSSIYGEGPEEQRSSLGPEPQELETGPGPGLDDIYVGPEGDVRESITLPDHLPIDPVMHALGLPQKAALYQIAPELEMQHRLENLALQEAERQGQPIARIYARIQRMQNMPAIKLAQERLELEQEFNEF